MANSRLNVDEIHANVNSVVEITNPSVTNLEQFDNTIAENTTIITGKNGLSVGPMAVADEVTVVVSDGSTWVII